MKNFLSEDFLLHTETSKKLYFDYAEKLPIIDYHSHLPPSEISEDKQFSNITEIWLEGDHYKWRAMRTLGIDEKFITGDATNKEKFDKWAYTIPYTVRNPLYHWSHLELKNYFGIETLLKSETSNNIYALCNDQLKQPGFSAKQLLHKMDVKVVCTTDDPADTLSDHLKISQQQFETQVLPTFRPDRAYAFGDPPSYNRYISQLEQVTGLEINSLDSLLQALSDRVDYFHQNGCRLSDHGLERLVYKQNNAENPEKSFIAIRNGQQLSDAESKQLMYEILLYLGKQYHKYGWVQQFHLGAMRNPNSRMYQKFGEAAGFDSIGDFSQGKNLARFLNELDKTDELPKTILYNLNPSDNALMATMAGNFNDGSIKGKIQFGTAWWFLDQKDGMEDQINILSNMGLLSCFVGMLTDSRSFLSYPRHEYFRRILCNLIGNDIENGELPADMEWFGKIVADVCYYNAEEYFGFNISDSADQRPRL
jgi:glucuronate isomerase